MRERGMNGYNTGSHRTAPSCHCCQVQQRAYQKSISISGYSERKKKHVKRISNWLLIQFLLWWQYKMKKGTVSSMAILFSSAREKKRKKAEIILKKKHEIMKTSKRVFFWYYRRKYYLKKCSLLHTRTPQSSIPHLLNSLNRYAISECHTQSNELKSNWSAAL